MTVRTDIAIDWNVFPRIIKVLAPSIELTVQDLVDTCRYNESLLLNIGNSHLIEAAGKEELGGGVTVGITATLQNAVVQFEGRAIPSEAGVCTQDEPTGRILYAAGGQFGINNIERGFTIFNATTGGMATIIDVISDTELVTQPLSGSVSSVWTAGDFYVAYDNVQCSLSGGNIVALDENQEVINPFLQSPNTNVIRTSSSSATLQELADIQYASFNGGVTIDITSVFSGATYPNGTPRQPVNNIDDAYAIAEIRGFPTIFIIGNLHLTEAVPDMKGYSFIGSGMDRTHISIDSDANVDDCAYYDAHVMGTLDGNSRLKGCVIDDLTYVKGYIEQCVLAPGTIVLAGTEEAHFLDCWSGVPGTSTPVIDMGGAGQSLALRNYNGGIRVINKTGAGDAVSIDLNSGQIQLGDNVTAGTIVLRGVGLLTEDLSNGANVINQLVNNTSMADTVWAHTTALDLLRSIDFLESIEGGMWEIINNQMIFYEDDNETEVARFNLFNQAGDPSSRDVFKRVRV